MAELMHNDVVHECLREKDYLVVEIEVAMLRAASPTALLILNRNAFVLKVIVLIPKEKVLMNNLSRKLPVILIVLSRNTHSSHTDSLSFSSVFLCFSLKKHSLNNTGLRQSKC